MPSTIQLVKLLGRVEVAVFVTFGDPTVISVARVDDVGAAETQPLEPLVEMEYRDPCVQLWLRSSQDGRAECVAFETSTDVLALCAEFVALSPRVAISDCERHNESDDQRSCEQVDLPLHQSLSGTVICANTDSAGNVAGSANGSSGPG